MQGPAKTVRETVTLGALSAFHCRILFWSVPWVPLQTFVHTRALFLTFIPNNPAARPYGLLCKWMVPIGTLHRVRVSLSWPVGCSIFPLWDPGPSLSFLQLLGLPFTSKLSSIGTQIHIYSSFMQTAQHIRERVYENVSIPGTQWMRMRFIKGKKRNKFSLSGLQYRLLTINFLTRKCLCKLWVKDNVKLAVISVVTWNVVDLYYGIAMFWNHTNLSGLPSLRLRI